MNATGIIRRIDELGRLVIPKEIRRTMKINEGDPLEICFVNHSIVLKKYNVDIVEQWHDSCIAYLEQYYEDPIFADVRFIYRNGVTTCIGFTSQHSKCIGISKWNALEDKYDPIIGQAIALCRALYSHACNYRNIIGLED